MENLLEKIELLRSKANISYTKAKEVLEACNYDVVEALVRLEEQGVPMVSSCRGKSMFSCLKDNVASLIRVGNQRQLLIKKQAEVVVKLPLTIIVIALLFMLPVVAAGLLLAVCTGHKMTIVNTGGTCPAVVPE